MNHDAQTFSTSGDTTKAKPEIDEIRRQRRSALTTDGFPHNGKPEDTKECYTTYVDPSDITTKFHTSTVIYETDNFGKFIKGFNVEGLPKSPQPPQLERTAIASSDCNTAAYADCNTAYADNHDFPEEICSHNNDHRYYCGTKLCSTISTQTSRTLHTFVVLTATLRPCDACSIRVQIIPAVQTGQWRWKQKARCVWSRSACTFKRPGGPRRRQGGSRRHTRAIMATVSM